MAVLLTTTGSPTWQSKQVKTYFEKLFLQEGRGEEVITKYAQKKRIPAGGGKTIEFTRVLSGGKAVTALTEGDNPADSTYTVETVSATIAEWGKVARVSSLLSASALDQCKEVVKAMAYDRTRTIHWQMVKEVAANAGSTIYANSATSLSNLVSSASNIVKADDLARARMILAAAHAKPINGFYVMFAPPEAIRELWKDSQFREAAVQQDMGSIEKGNIVKYGGILIVEMTLENYWINGAGSLRTSTNAGLPLAGTLGVSGTGYNVVKMPIVGQDAFAAIDLESKGLSNRGSQYNELFIVSGPDKYDPLDRQTAIGFCVPFVAKTLNSAFILDLASVVTHYIA